MNLNNKQLIKKYKLAIKHNIYFTISIFIFIRFLIADLKIFSWCNIIQQIKNRTMGSLAHLAFSGGFDMKSGGFQRNGRIHEPKSLA